MRLRRGRRETLNEQLLREAGLDAQSVAVAATASVSSSPAADDHATEPRGLQDSSPPDPFPWQPAATHRVSQYPASALRGVTLPRADDAVVTVHSAGLTADAIQFVTLPDGTVLVEEPATDEDVGALADAVDQALPRPYRARCRRQEGDLWAIGQRLDVRQLPGLAGDVLTLTVFDGERTLEVDGAVADGAVPALDAIADADRDGDVVVHAERLDGDWWELDVGDL